MMDRFSAPHCLAGENWLDAPSEKTLAVAAIGLCFFRSSLLKTPGRSRGGVQ